MGRFYLGTSQKWLYFLYIFFGIYPIRNAFSIIKYPAGPIPYILAILSLVPWLLLELLIIIRLCRRRPLIQIDAEGVTVVMPVRGVQSVAIEEIIDVVIMGKKVILKKRNGKQLVIREIKLLKKEEQNVAIRCFESLAALKKNP